MDLACSTVYWLRSVSPWNFGAVLMTCTLFCGPVGRSNKWKWEEFGGKWKYRLDPGQLWVGRWGWGLRLAIIDVNDWVHTHQFPSLPSAVCSQIDVND